MRALIAASAVMALMACGNESSEHDRIGWSYDAMDSSGLRVRYYSPNDPPLNWHSWLWSEVQACTRLSAPAPLVVYAETSEGLGCNAGTWGCTFLESGRIVVESQYSDGNTTQTFRLAHEFVHWLTHYNQVLTVEQNAGHASPLFSQCINFVTVQPVYPQ